jgi:hypothetical protein
MRTDGQTDMTKLICALRNFANAFKILHSVHSVLFVLFVSEEKRDYSLHGTDLFL